VSRRPWRSTAFALLFAVPTGAAQAQRIVEVQIAPPFVRMVPDAQVQASATAYDSTGTPVVVRFRWMSSNINVATVSENGLVRGVAPGTTLISAVYEGQRGGRRRAMQVQVLARGQSATGVTVVPVAPGAPPTQIPVTPPAVAMPGTPPPGAPPMVYVMPRGVDSTMKASVNCNEPMINAVNPLQACYDQRPTPRMPPAATLTPCPDQPNTWGMSVLLMARVSETGTVSEVMPFIRNICPQLVDAAVTTARAMTFNPALRDGRPVGAWVRLFLHTTEPPPKQ